MTLSKRPIESITDVYEELSSIYSCKFADTMEERDRAIRELTHFINNQDTEKRVDYELMFKKMYELKANTNDFQSKLCSHILNRFWEKSFSEMIPRKRFSFNQ